MINKNILIILKLLVAAILFNLSGCAAFHPETCEESCCESSEENPPFKFDNEHPTTTIEICACKPWNKSGIMVNKNEKYFFKVKKIIEPWQDGIIRANPHDGWSEGKFFGFLISPMKRSSARWYQLVATIGKSDDAAFEPLDYFSEKEPFEVKTEGSQELYFYANDADLRYFNNRGLLLLEITKINP